MMAKFLYFLRKPWIIFVIPLSYLPYFSFLRNTGKYQNKAGFEFWFKQKILGLGGNRAVYWPVHPASQVYDWENIYAGIDTCPGLMKGCYIQGKGGIHIGDYTQIAPNVVIVSANHNIYDSREHILGRVEIGKYSWIGAGAKIMPGVKLGDFTIVGAGAVVTKSFPEGFCILAGVPARQIHELDRLKCVRYELNPKYYGYLNKAMFEKLQTKFPGIY